VGRSLSAFKLRTHEVQLGSVSLRRDRVRAAALTARYQSNGLGSPQMVSINIYIYTHTHIHTHIFIHR